MKEIIEKCCRRIRTYVRYLVLIVGISSMPLFASAQYEDVLCQPWLVQEFNNFIYEHECENGYYFDDPFGPTVQRGYKDGFEYIHIRKLVVYPPPYQAFYYISKYYSLSGVYLGDGTFGSFEGDFEENEELLYNCSDPYSNCSSNHDEFDWYCLPLKDHSTRQIYCDPYAEFQFKYEYNVGEQVQLYTSVYTWDKSLKFRFKTRVTDSNGRVIQDFYKPTNNSFIQLGSNKCNNFYPFITPTNAGTYTVSNYVVYEDGFESQNICTYSFDVIDTPVDTIRPFITTWDTRITSQRSSDSLSIEIPGVGMNYTVKWENIDGLNVKGSKTDCNNTVMIQGLTPGRYRVSISPGNGTFHQIKFDNMRDKDKILSINQWGDIKWSSMFHAFLGCSNLTLDADDTPNLEKVESLDGMFDSTLSFNGDLNKWDVTNVKFLNHMFKNARLFNSDLSMWDTGNITIMNSMFDNAISFNQDLSKWNTANVTGLHSMGSMFKGASSFNQNLGSWILNPDVDLRNMFDDSGMDCHNYSSTLIGWAENNPNVRNRALGAKGMKYGTNAVEARNTLISRGWTIIGDTPIGKDCTLPEQDAVQIRLSAPVSANKDDTISIPVLVNGFKDIISFQFPVSWDPDKLDFLGVRNLADFKNFSMNAIKSDNTSEGWLHCDWWVINDGITINKDDTLFIMDFRVLGQVCDSTLVSISHENGPVYHATVRNVFNLSLPIDSSYFNAKIKLNPGRCHDCTHPDYEALMVLYHATNGDNWKDNRGWGTNCDPCGWHGVMCNNGRVIRLILKENQLMGSIPPELGDLGSLQILNFGINQLSDTIPHALGNLSDLQELYLYANQLSGKIPTQLGNLTLLETLDLGTNQLSDTIPHSIGNLIQLQYLHLQRNQLKGKIPHTLGELQSLRRLYLQTNHQLSDTIPHSLGNLKNLVQMDLSRNQLSGVIPHTFRNLDNISVLYVSENNLSGCIPVELTNLCGRNLKFDNNPFLPYGGDFAKFCAGEPQLGAPCNNGLGTIQDDCACNSGCITFNSSHEYIICQGTSYTLPNDSIVSTAGSYPVTLMSSYGCDSIITTQLTVLPVISLDTLVVLCEGDSLTIGGQKYYEPGIYTDILQAVTGCDSIVRRTLSFLPTTDAGLPLSEMLTLCQDTTVSLNTLITGHDTGGTWTLGNIPLTGTVLFTADLDIGDHTLRYTVSNPCDTSVASISLHIQSCMKDDDCAVKLRDDSLAVKTGQAFSIRVLDNDEIPYDDFTVSIVGDYNDFLSDLSLDGGVISGSVKKPFFEPIRIEYEVCTSDCDECSHAELILINEALKDVIQTTVIIPGSEGDNARLRFTKDDILEGSELYIFNRNGDHIFYMKDYDQSWNADGYPGGIYYYVLRYNGVDIKKVLTVMK